MELHSSEGKRRQGKKDQRPRSNSGPTLYRGVSATRATETGRDPSSPIALMYRSQVRRYTATLKTCASRLVLCAMKVRSTENGKRLFSSDYNLLISNILFLHENSQVHVKTINHINGTSQLRREKATGKKGPATALELGTYALSRSFSHASHGDRSRSFVPHRPYVPVTGAPLYSDA